MRASGRTRHLVAALAMAAASAQTARAADPAVAAQALDILKRSIAFRTVEGGGQIPAYADYLKDVLVAGGFKPADVIFTKIGETGTLVARWPGGDPAKKPLVLSGHMDVVEAMAKDWTRDPFVPVIENGYLFGRGSVDDKFDTSVTIATLIGLKREDFRPSRTIILALSGDEETDMTTSALLAEQLKGAEMVLNGDGGGGLLGEDGKPVMYNLQGGEKTYADFQFTTTNPGGHSSRPGPTNAIYELARAIDRVAAYKFPAQQNPLTVAYFKMSAARTPGAAGKAMTAYAADPNDQAAIDTLSAIPEYIGQVRTTCVTTMLKGGHALNALPQSASFSVNCRIMPGVSVESVRDKLVEVIGDPKVSVNTLGKPRASDPSPLRPDVMAAVRKAVDARYPGLPIVPGMAAGASDSLYFRAVGVPSYGIGGLFLKASDDFTHGLNERVPVSAIAGAAGHWHSILVDLAK